MINKDIAIIGGTFDPVHIGHVQMVKYIIDNSYANEVWVLPSYNSPHKKVDTIKSFNHRINMLILSLKDIDNVHISRYEEKYEIEHPLAKTYTYEILDELKKKYTNYSFKFVVGFDSIKEITGITIVKTVVFIPGFKLILRANIKTIKLM